MVSLKGTSRAKWYTQNAYGMTLIVTTHNPALSYTTQPNNKSHGLGNWGRLENSTADMPNAQDHNNM